MKKILHLLGSRAAKGILAALLLLFALWVSGLEAVGSRLLSFPFASLAFILLLLLANLWLVAFRYWHILVHFSYRVSFAMASRVTLAGHLAGLLVFSLLGQAVLRQIGITPVVNSTLAGYERGLLVVVSGMLAFLSGANLLSQELVNDFFHCIPVIEIVALILFSLIVSIKVGGTDFESRMMSRALTARNMAHVGFICGLTVVSQFLVLAYSQLFANAAGALRLRKRIFETALIGIMRAGLAWTGSRAGWLAGGAVLLAGISGGMLRWHTLIQSGLAACALWFGFWLAPDLLGADGSHWSQVQSFISGDDSNTERWKTWTEAIRLWLDSPIWGAGLGVFLAKSGEWLSRPQVVHSTPLWVLAEFGLIGIAVIVWSARKFLGYFRATASTPSSPHRWALIYLLLGLAVFGLFHEIFYQHIMWLILGAAMALPGSVARPGKGDGQ